MKPIYNIKEERKVSPKLLFEMKSEVASIIENFSRYLEDFIPKGTGFSKSSIVGPVGKLLSAVLSSKFGVKDALIGYTINIHNNTSEKQLSDEGRKSLEEAVEKLIDLKQKSPKRFFAKAIREVDYGVYKRKLEYIFERAREKREKGEE